MLSLFWLPLFPMRSHLLIVLFGGNKNVKHYFVLLLPTFSLFFQQFGKICLCVGLYPSWDSMDSGICNFFFFFFFFSKVGKSSATIYSNVFSEFFFSSLSWIFVLCTLECLIVSPMSENVYFCFLNWMIPIDLSSRLHIPSSAISNLLWNSLNFLFQFFYFSNTEFLYGSITSFF